MGRTGQLVRAEGAYADASREFKRIKEFLRRYTGTES
jgi:hypothetical protein